MVQSLELGCGMRYMEPGIWTQGCWSRNRHRVVSRLHKYQMRKQVDGRMGEGDLDTDLMYGNTFCCENVRFMMTAEKENFGK